MPSRDREELDEGCLVVLISYAATIVLPIYVTNGSGWGFLIAIFGFAVVTFLFFSGWLWS